MTIERADTGGDGNTYLSTLWVSVIDALIGLLFGGSIFYWIGFIVAYASFEGSWIMTPEGSGGIAGLFLSPAGFLPGLIGGLAITGIGRSWSVGTATTGIIGACLGFFIGSERSRGSEWSWIGSLIGCCSGLIGSLALRSAKTSAIIRSPTILLMVCFRVFALLTFLATSAFIVYGERFFCFLDRLEMERAECRFQDQYSDARMIADLGVFPGAEILEGGRLLVSMASPEDVVLWYAARFEVGVEVETVVDFAHYTLKFYPALARGKIDVEAVPGKGTVIRWLLPSD